MIKSSSLILSLIFFLFGYSKSEVTTPAVRFTFSESGIRSLEKEFLPVLMNQTKINLPDNNNKQHLDFIGTVELNITNSVLSFVDVDPERVSVKFGENATIYIDMVNITGMVNFDYVFKSGFYQNTSPGFVKVSNLTLRLVNQLSSQPNEIEPSKLSPAIEIKEVNIESIKVDINFQNMGNLEKFIKYLVDNLQSMMVETIKTELKKVLMNTNVEINKGLANIQLHSDIAGTNVSLDYTLADSPSVYGDLLEVNFNATIKDKISNTTYEGPLKTIPHIKNTTAPMDGFINQYLFDSIAYILYKANQTNYYLSNPLISTMSLALVIPELFQHYQAIKTVDIFLQAQESPQLQLTENLTIINLNYDSDFIVNLNETNKVTAFSANLSLTLNVSASMNQGTIKAKIYSININSFNVTNSSIGPINDKDLATNLNGFINGFLQVIENALNDFVKNIKIPSIYGVTFNDSIVESHEGYLQFAITPHLENKTNLIKAEEKTNFLNSGDYQFLKFLN